MESLYDFWFVDFRAKWFSSSAKDDEFISNTFGHLLDCEFTDCTSCKKQLVSCIILYDQIPRHVYRNSCASHIIEYFLQKALVYSEYVLETMHDLEIKELVFCLLPLRHTKQQARISQVMHLIWQHKPKNNDDRELYRRFITATFTKCQMDQTLNVQWCVGPLDDNDFSDSADILQLTGAFNKLDNIPSKCQLFGSVRRLLAEIPSYEPIIISLSGGCDSMALSFVLAHLAVKQQRIVSAVHINYKNKPKCDKEEAFVAWWCAQLQIPIAIRRITEIQRAPCMELELRDLYESYTRNVRYNTYITAAVKNPIVFMGHNKDDCFENIFCGITHCHKYENLQGMQPQSGVSTPKGPITFCRPFLSIPKAAIREFNKLYNIPHLYDSTPSWSQRGRIRDVIVPTLTAWNPITIQSFFELSRTLEDLYACVTLCVDNLKSMTRFIDDDTLLLTLGHVELLLVSKIAWRNYIYALFREQISNSSLDNMIGKLRATRSYTIVVSKRLTIYKAYDQLSSKTQLTFVQQI